MYSVHSQHRAIQGDNYNIPYCHQLSLRWTLFELVSILETCLSYTNVQSRMNGAKLTVILKCLFYGGDLIIEVSKKREVTVHTWHRVIQRNNIMGKLYDKKHFLPIQISHHIVLSSRLSFNRHLWKKATSLKWTTRFVPCLSLLLSCNSTCTQDEYLS